MLVLIQFPFADLRPFAGDASDVAIGPLWSLAPDGRNPDFVRGFGPLRARPRIGDGQAVRAWTGEAWFARASHAIRFPQLTGRDFASAGVPLVPQLALRRVFSDGCALWRVEIGLAFDPRTEPDFRQILAVLVDFLALKLRVKTRAGHEGASRWTDPAPLSRLAEPIGRALFEATTYRDAPPTGRTLKLRAGRPMILVETRAIDGAAMWQPTVDGNAKTRSVTLRGERRGSKVEVDFGTMAIDRIDSPFVLLRSSTSDGGEATREVRTHLCRLHAEREVLTQVLKAAERGRIERASKAFERYLGRAETDLFAETRFGVRQDDLQAIFDVYDRITPAETQALTARLVGLKQTRQRAESLAASYREDADRARFSVEDGRVTINFVTNHVAHVHGDNHGVVAVDAMISNTGTLLAESARALPSSAASARPVAPADDPSTPSRGASMNMHGNQVSIGGANTGIVNVDATFTNSGTIIQGMDDGHLKTALTALKETGERLVAHLPDDAKKQAVANKVEAMTKEATSKEPDVDMLKVTGKGLIEAAKTVADMAAPIAKAVIGVLTICGVVL